MISSVFPHSADTIYMEKWLYILVCSFFLFVFFFFYFVFALYVVSLVCDTVKWFLAFVRHRMVECVECGVAFTASGGHRLLQQGSGLGEEISVTAFTLLF